MQPVGNLKERVFDLFSLIKRIQFKYLLRAIAYVSKKPHDVYVSSDNTIARTLLPHLGVNGVWTAIALTTLCKARAKYLASKHLSRW